METEAVVCRGRILHRRNISSRHHLGIFQFHFTVYTSVSHEIRLLISDIHVLLHSINLKINSCLYYFVKGAYTEYFEEGGGGGGGEEG